MSSTKRTTKATVSFGEPLTDLPEPARGPGKSGPAEHWVRVAKYVKDRPGAWHPVTIGHLTVNAHASAVSSINAASRNSSSKTGKNTAFMEPGFQAIYRKHDGGLLVRYDPPAKVRSIGRRADKAAS